MAETTATRVSTLFRPISTPRRSPRCSPDRWHGSWPIGRTRASNGSVNRPEMRVTGPVLDAPDVAVLTRFYEQLLGWEVEELEGPRPGHPAGDGWSRLRPADRSTKIEIQFEEHYVRPCGPGAPGDARDATSPRHLGRRRGRRCGVGASRVARQRPSINPRDRDRAGCGSCSTPPDIRSVSGPDAPASVWSVLLAGGHLAEAAGAVVVERLHELVAGVHHERSVLARPARGSADRRERARRSSGCGCPASDRR